MLLDTAHFHTEVWAAEAFARGNATVLQLSLA